MRSVFKFLMMAATVVPLATSLAVSPVLAGKKDNSIRMAYDQVPESIDPFFNNVRIGVIIGHHVWDTLIYRDPKTNEYKPSLATKWTWTDPKTLDIDLREGVKFHNGDAFTADDVVFTLNFVSKPANKVTTQTNVNWIESAEKLGPYKVRVKLKEVFPAAIEYLAGPVVMHSAAYYTKVGPSGSNEKPVGTGPFRVTDHAIGKTVKMERNPDYFKDSPKGQPKIEKFEIRFIPDRQTQMAEAMAGGIDFIMYVPPDQADFLKANPALQVVSGETMRIAFIQFHTMDNTAVPAIKDVRVRQAISHAIDREKLAKALVGEGARVIHTQCFPSQFGCTDEGAKRYEFNPAKAKALLAEAGVPNLEIDFGSYRERGQAEAMIGMLQAVGIKANLRFLQYAALRDQQRGQKMSVAHQTWGSFSVNDVSASTPVFLGGGDDDHVKDPEVIKLLKTGDTSVDPEARKAAYAAALKLIAEKAYTLPLWSLPVYYVATKDLNFTPYPDELPRLWEATWK